MSTNSIIFAGSSPESLPFLEFLIENYSKNTLKNSFASDYALQFLTKEPRVQQRNHQLLPNVVEVLAKKSDEKSADDDDDDDVPVFYDLASLKQSNESQNKSDDDRPELGIAVSYGNLIPADYLNYPKHGWINVHFSLLPQYRGASPVQSALLNGDHITGVTIFQLVEKLDAGPIYQQEKIEIDDNDDYGSLIEKLSNLGVRMLKDLVPRILANEIIPTEQKGEVSYCHKFQTSDRELKFEENIELWFNKIRAFGPKPGAYLYLDEAKAKTLKIIKAQKPQSDFGKDLSQDQINLLPKFPINSQSYFFKFQQKIYLSHQNEFLEILEVQPSNKAIMEATSWFNGLQNKIG